MPDAVSRTKDRVYVFEFKVDGSAEEALKQIDGKGYMIPFKKEGRCVKVGVNISSATRTLESRRLPRRSSGTGIFIERINDTASP